MDVNMEDLLASIFTVIDHYAKPLSQLLFCSNFSGNYQQMTQQLKVKGKSKDKNYSSINMILGIGINQERQQIMLYSTAKMSFRSRQFQPDLILNCLILTFNI